jgi:hypothetical protein
MYLHLLLRLVVLLALMMEAGCAALLPSAKAVSESPWLEYGDAKKAFDSITIGKTTVDDLKELGFDVKASPNLKVMNYLDVAATLQAIPIQELDPGLQACIKARDDCRAYVFEPTRTYTHRVGNFWLDVWRFRRKTHETGWHFKALIVFVNHTVAYKLSSGEPQIDHMKDEVNPLGPFQVPINIITRYIPFLTL